MRAGRLCVFQVCVVFGTLSIQTAAGAQGAGGETNQAIRVNEAILLAPGFGNTFMVTTAAGNVIVDTSSAAAASSHFQILRASNKGEVKVIVLTHAHPDHTGGVNLWRQQSTEVIAQSKHVDFSEYQTRLGEFFARRNAAQFGGLPVSNPPPAATTSNAVMANRFFDDKYEFTLGDMQFQLFSTPGETPDHLTVWIPKYRAAFIGDNFYESFPNLYTLRGTTPRWALDYIKSINKVLALKPELLLPSHGQPIRGAEEISRRLTRYRDAIQYAHDKTVEGMNAGKDVYTLMREIKLPENLQVGESYGKLAWSIRGIYEGYAGWFDTDPATMYDVPVSAVLRDLVNIAGGAEPVVRLAQQRADEGQYVAVLHLTKAALAYDRRNAEAFKIRLHALQQLRTQSNNRNEQGWLDAEIRRIKDETRPR